MFFHLRKVNSKHTLLPWALAALPCDIIASSTDEINTYETHYGIKDGNLYINGVLANSNGDIIKLYLNSVGILVETSQTKEEYQAKMESFFKKQIEDNVENFVPSWRTRNIPVKLGDVEIGYAVEKSDGVYNVHITADNVIPEDKENISFSIRSESSESRKRTIEDIYRQAVGRRSFLPLGSMGVNLRKPTIEELVKFNDGLEAQFGRGRDTAKGGENRIALGPFHAAVNNLCYEDWEVGINLPADWDEWVAIQKGVDSIATLLGINKPTPIGEITADGKKILDRQITTDVEGNVISDRTTYEQFGMVHYDSISAPGIDVSKFKKDKDND